MKDCCSAGRHSVRHIEITGKMVRLTQCAICGGPQSRFSGLRAPWSTVGRGNQASWSYSSIALPGSKRHNSLLRSWHEFTSSSEATKGDLAVSGPCGRVSGTSSSEGDFDCHGQCSNENEGGGTGQKTRRVVSRRQPCSGGLAEAASEAVQTLDERARGDVEFLIRSILKLDMRAKQDVAYLGSKFMKFDARARADAEKLDQGARSKVARLRHIAMGFEEVARAELITVAEEHWSAGGLDADLRLADLRARRRAMEDAYVALQVVKNVHNALLQITQLRETDVPAKRFSNSASLLTQAVETSTTDSSQICGRTVTERLSAMEDAYWEMAASLARANRSEVNDPDDIEFIVAALLDMNEVDGGNGASLLAQYASSPDVATRRALANVLSAAPSLWNLGNAGMGALQKLAEDSNPAVAAAAGNAINELKQQWQQQVENALRFQLDSDDGSMEGEDNSAY